jgi:mitochondrial intermediate peptidase
MIRLRRITNNSLWQLTERWASTTNVVSPTNMKRPSAPGLFGLEHLVKPNDFLDLTKTAVGKITVLVREITERDVQRRADPNSTWNLPAAQRLLDDLDCISYTLCDVVDTAELVRQSHSSEEFRAAADGVYHGLSDVLAQLSSSKGLYWSIRSLTDDETFFNEQTTDEHQRMAIMLQREFERDGIHMSDEDQKKVMEYRNQITRLETAFVQIASGQTGPDEHGKRSDKDYAIVSKKKLKFLPKQLLDSFPNANASNFFDDQVVVPMASYYGGDEIIETTNLVCDDRSLRSLLYKTKHHKDMEQNARSLQALEDLLIARHSLAKLLGFQSYADMQVREGDRMLENKENVLTFLTKTRARLETEIQKEKRLLERELPELDDNNSNNSGEGEGEGKEAGLQLWDLSYCSNRARRRVQRERHLTATPADLECMEYFEVDNVVNGLGVVCHSLFGVSLREVPVSKWKNTAEDWVDEETHSIRGARKIEAIHETEGHIGTVYLDLYPRDGKYRGAGHFVSRCGHVNPGERSEDGAPASGAGDEDSFQMPIVALLMNFAKPDRRQSLLSHYEVETIFHEFGHALHSLLSRTRYQHLSGTRTLLDFVEVPSHVFEHFVWDHRVLSKFAKHHLTGETIPKHLVDRMNEQKKIFWSVETDQQLVLSLLDQKIHSEMIDDQNPTVKKTTEVLHEVQSKYSVIPPFDHMATHSRFTHFVGYGCGYYSYLYARILSAHIWSVCFEKDPLSREAGELYRQELLRHGGAKDPNVIMKNVLGEVPQIDRLVDSFISSKVL